MDINQIIVYVLIIFAILGAADYIAGNKFGFGTKFEEGIQAMGALTISMAGLIVLTPVLTKILKPLVVPVFEAIGADPAMFAGMFFCIDMGAAPLADELAATPEAAGLGGIITSAMLGATIMFSIPVALGIIRAEDRNIFAKGILLGMITVPLGVLAGGIVAGFDMSMILKNTVPVAIMSAVIAIGMWKFQSIMIKIFMIFGKGILALSIFGFVVGALSAMAGIEIFEEITPIKEAFIIIGNIAIMLAGAFPLVHFLTKILNKPLMTAGKKMGINEISAAGFLVSLPNNIPMLGMVKDMDERGKLMNIAFSVSGAFILGDHLGFAAGYNQEMIVPMMAGKVVAGITAGILAYFVSKH